MKFNQIAISYYEYSICDNQMHSDLKISCAQTLDRTKLKRTK